MTQWAGLMAELPVCLLAAALGLVMLLDTMPLLGVLVPGDLAVLAVTTVDGPLGDLGAMLVVVVGCLAGWSLSFLAGRYLGDRLRRSRLGGWIGEARWSAAEGVLGRGGGRLVLVAPFLPVLNTLVPLAAGGLRMSYRRFLPWAALGAALWGGLYVLLGAAGRSLGGLLPADWPREAITVAVGLLVGGIVLLGIRRRLRVAADR